MRFEATPLAHGAWLAVAVLVGLASYQAGASGRPTHAPSEPAPVAAAPPEEPRPVVTPICTPIPGDDGRGDCSRFESHCVADDHCEVRRHGGNELGALSDDERRALSLGLNGGTVVHETCVGPDCSTYVDVCGHHSEETARCTRDLRVHYVEPVLPRRAGRASPQTTVERPQHGHARARRETRDAGIPLALDDPGPTDLALVLEGSAPPGPYALPAAPAPETYRHHRVSHPSEPGAYTYRSHHYPSYSHASHSSGSVHVRGYYRRDGTYVRPHTRRR